MGTLAGGVAHDFNNMLNVILGQTEFALERLPPDSPLREHLEEIQKAGQRSADLTRQLLAFARKQTIAPKAMNLNDIIDSMLKMLSRLIGEDIDLLWKPSADLGAVCVDPSQIDQLLANLVINARDAIGAKNGKVTIETHNVSFNDEYCAGHLGFSPGDFVMLGVSDNGCGINPDILPHLFEPFFTTKRIGKGTGLGLATVYGIVKQNQGFINVYSEPGQGTTFKIYLPLHDGQALPVAKQATEKPATDNKETILLVEDEPSILNISTMMLENFGYTVLTAETPEKAIKLASEHAGEIHLLMTDVVMPEMNGRELARKILALYPELKCLFMSGYTANVIAHHGVLDQDVFFIQKPFSMNDLADKVRETLDTRTRKD
ncbi:MAG: ATP-binding protein [Candidatus Riflebacteria bacterium]|nr:ATP-binding protein [Candidatus Riflebacteria bacterium]